MRWRWGDHEGGDLLVGRAEEKGERVLIGYASLRVEFPGAPRITTKLRITNHEMVPVKGDSRRVCEYDREIGSIVGSKGSWRRRFTDSGGHG